MRWLKTLFSKVPQDRKYDLMISALQVIAQALGLGTAVVSATG